MPRKDCRAFPDNFERFDFSLSGIVLLALVALLHMTSAGIDLLEAAQAAVIGPEQMIQLMDVAVGTGLALFPFLRARLHRLHSQALSRKPDCSL